MRRSAPAAAALAALLALAAASACTEEALTGVEGEEPPGQAADSRTLAVPVDELALWRDTTYTGFATVQDVPFVIAADQAGFRSRALLTINGVPDSIGGQPIDSVGEMFLQVVADTVRSAFSGDSATLEIHSLSQRFSPEEATWERAEEGRPWQTAGGDLETKLAELGFRLAAEGDSLTTDELRVPFGGAADSLIAAWSAAGAVPAMALRVRGEGNRLVIRQLRMALRARNADMDSLELVTAVDDSSTFIHDPPLPPAGQRLRLGGLPASRFYFVFLPPDTVGDIPLRGSQVNRAELIFHPASDSASVFRPSLTLGAGANRLLADPFELGPRTPIGPGVGDRRTFPLRPDSLEAGRPIRLRVTGLVQAWADAPPDSLEEFRVGVRPIPDGQDLGFWEFGSVEAAPEVRPELRLVITPPTDFSLP